MVDFFASCSIFPPCFLKYGPVAFLQFVEKQTNKLDWKYDLSEKVFKKWTQKNTRSKNLNFINMQRNVTHKNVCVKSYDNQDGRDRNIPKIEHRH